mmetsp:Transcript_23720/g.55275  ORF Transcript_23720/g.55275 Transcript_23720/m.55275 type:complete len:211 (-) Transcript_23720:110-742(-)
MCPPVAAHALDCFVCCRFSSCADNLNSLGNCADLKICVEADTTQVSFALDTFPSDFVVQRPTAAEVIQGLSTGDCNAVLADSVTVTPSMVTASGQYNGQYEMGVERYGNEPLTPMTKQNDPEWSDFVYWVIASTIYAEEQGITQANGNSMPTSSLFGTQFFRAFGLAIEAVGNYGEIYQRNLESLVPRSGGNRLNEPPFGPQIFVRPGTS